MNAAAAMPALDKVDRWRRQYHQHHPDASGRCVRCCTRFPCPPRVAASECLINAGVPADPLDRWSPPMTDSPHHPRPGHHPLPVSTLAARLAQLTADGNGDQLALLNLDPNGAVLDPTTRGILARYAWVATDLQSLPDGGDGVLIAFTAQPISTTPAQPTEPAERRRLGRRLTQRAAGILIAIAVWLTRPRQPAAAPRRPP